MTWVFSALVTATGQCWAWFDLYMPECWAKDPARRKKAGIPRGLGFATKPELAIAQVRTVIERGVRVCWVAAGRSLRPVRGLPGRLPGPAAVLRRDRPLRLQGHPRQGHRAGPRGRGRPGRRVRTAVRRERDERPPLGWWALLATADPEEFLLVRKLEREKNPYTYYLCHAAPGRPATLGYFVTIASRRWPVETSFKSGKDGFGWDQSQVATWTAQNRHTLLTALAMIRIIFLRTFLASGNADGEPLPVPAASAAADGTASTSTDLRIHPGADTVPVIAGLPCPAGIPPVRLSDTETARIDALTRAYTGGLLSRDRLAFHFRWSHWRRRHQARARWSHYSTRLAPVTG